MNRIVGISIVIPTVLIILSNIMRLA